MVRALTSLGRIAYARLRRYLGYVMFERPRGLETSKVVTLSELGLAAEDRADYEPSPWSALRRVLSQKDVSGDDVFIDFGSGKAPVVLQAARYPFRKVIGVELSSELHRIASSNVERARAGLRCTDVELVNEDVLDYDVPDEVTVAYFFNPFQGATFSAVVDKLVASLRRRPRVLRIIYMNPTEEALLFKAGATLLRTSRGLRPSKSWSQANTIRMYVLAPSGAGISHDEVAV